MKEGKLYKEGLERYPLGCVIGQNIFFLAYFGIGFIGMLPLRIHGFPAISAFYALFLIIMLLFVLRKHLCTHCYYYGRTCNTGWGKLSASMFKKNSGSYELGVKLANATWMFAILFPIAVMSAEVYLNMLEFPMLAIFVILSGVNFLIHANACKKCKMRFICPASMAKGG